MSSDDDRCGAPTAAGGPCRAWPVEGSTRCVVHQDIEPAPAEDDESRCGAPTTRGGVCRNHPMAGSDHCHHHMGLEPTQAQEEARRTAGLKHGYFVTGFLTEDERELFAEVLEGTTDIGELKQHLIAALVVRTTRMLKWEAQGQQISGFLNEAIGELRKTLESVSPDELRVHHSWDDAEVAQQVRRVLASDPELLVRLLPPEVQETVRQAL